MKRIACLPLLSLTLALTACGGGGTGSTGVVSTPVTPAVTYKKLSELSGDQAFQTADLRLSFSNAGFTNPVPDSFGSGVVVGYGAATDTYTLTYPGLPPVTFFPSEVTSTGTGTGGTFVNWAKPNGTGGFTDRLNILRPAVSGVLLSYTLLGNWTHFDTAATTYLAVGGIPTVASDMPKTGTASYSQSLFGTVVQPSTTGGAPASFALAGASTSTFTANFGAGTVSNTLNLNSTTGVSFGTFTGTGTIASGSNGFSGTYAGTTQSAFTGAFFGPQAAEMAFNYQLATPTWNAAGQVFGVKQ